MSKKNFKSKNKNHIYPHIKEKYPEMNRKLYEEHKLEFDNWTQEEKEKRGFRNHCHPRRFFIFLDRYYDLIKHYMTDEEKAAHPEHLTTGGYLKTVDFKTACQRMWGRLNDEEKEAIKEIPNFDAAVFKEITGIEV